MVMCASRQATSLHYDAPCPEPLISGDGTGLSQSWRRTTSSRRTAFAPCSSSLRRWSWSRRRGAALIGSRHRIEHDRDFERPAQRSRTRASAQSGPPLANDLVKDRSVAPPVEMPGVPQLDHRRRWRKQFLVECSDEMLVEIGKPGRVTTAGCVDQLPPRPGEPPAGEVEQRQREVRCRAISLDDEGFARDARLDLFDGAEVEHEPMARV